MRLSNFKVLSFDCYGTLIDWEAGLAKALQPLARRSGIEASELLEAYGPIEHEVEAEHPALVYSELLRIVHSRLCQRFGVAENAEEAAAFGASVGNWPAFPDVAEALAYLKQHFQLVILSNVDRRSFADSHQRLGVEFDHILTAEEIGSYKPSLRNFDYMIERLAGAEVAKGDLLHVAQSLFHDHAPANALGIASAWIDRRHDKLGSGATPVPEPMPHYDFRFTSLGALAAAHRSEVG